MNTIELHKILSSILKNEKCFAGVFPKDRIKITKRNNFGIIINTDVSTGRGKHWVSFFVKNGKGLYFDSFGLPPYDNDIKKFIFKICKKNYIYNKKRLQSLSSKTCGVYSMLFLIWCCKGKKMKSFLNLFSNIPVLNDIVVNRFFKAIKRTNV